MPEYRRFVAYFYEYIDGKKKKNAGFAKVELRNGMWRILFRLMVAVPPEEPIQVYGFVREQGYLLGFSMGSMETGYEIGEEWAYEGSALIGHEKYRFADLSGIWICSKDERVFATVWDEEGLDTQKFVLEMPGKQNVKVQENVPGETEIVIVQPMEPLKEADIVEMELQEEHNDRTCALEKRAEGKQIEEIFQKRKKFQPFSDGEITNCVQIMPCDVVRLQQENWRVGRSSFLQHGFYQYRHLLLGKEKEGNYVLGVPGERNDQEQYLAEMFGYDRFKGSKIYDHGKKYGYWCRTLTQ